MPKKKKPRAARDDETVERIAEQMLERHAEQESLQLFNDCAIARARDYVRDWRLRDLVERLDDLIDQLEDDLGEDDLTALKAAAELLHELRAE